MFESFYNSIVRRNSLRPMIIILERFKVVAADVPTNRVLHDGSGYLIGLAVFLNGRAWLDRNL
jgi:hypothetical protein